MRKIILIGIICMFLISCQNVQKQERETDISGSKGITLSFLDETPPSRILVGTAGERFDVTVVTKNEGGFDTETTNIAGKSAENDATVYGEVYLSGFDKNIIGFTGHGTVPSTPADTFTKISNTLTSKELNGRSYQNKIGGFDYVDFTGFINYAALPVQPYKPKLTATSCYNYETQVSVPVCIDFEPNKKTVEKVCKTSPINLGSQGAPISITSIEEEVLASIIRFKIKIKNVGGGDVFSARDSEAPNKHDTTKCNPTAIGLKRKNFDLVTLDSVNILRSTGTVDFVDLSITDTDKGTKCTPLKKEIKNDDAGTEIANSKAIKLLDGDGFIICTAPKTLFTAQPQGYTTPLEIILSYAYRTTIQKDIEIVKTEG